jgi:hypothetical protein
VANSDVELAAEYATRLPLGNAQGQAIQNVAAQWGHRDPVAALQWVTRLPESQVPVHVYAQITGQWFNADPEAARQWMTTQPAGERRDQLVESPISQLAYQAPQEAVRMLDLVTDAGRRQRLMQQIGQQWLQQDRAGAEQWIRGSGLPAEVQQRLLAPPGQNQPNQNNVYRNIRG